MKYNFRLGIVVHSFNAQCLRKAEVDSSLSLRPDTSLEWLPEQTDRAIQRNPVSEKKKKEDDEEGGGGGGKIKNPGTIKKRNNSGPE